jgi:hypothetical protein
MVPEIESRQGIGWYFLVSEAQLPSTLPPPQFGNDCQLCLLSSSCNREQFTSVILKVLIYKCNFQASLNHRANALVKKKENKNTAPRPFE